MVGTASIGMAQSQYGPKPPALTIYGLSMFTTLMPAIPDVFDSGRNVGALRPGRCVGFRCLAPGLQTTFAGDILFL